MAPSQFSLRALLVLITACCGAAATTHWIGLRVAAALLGLMGLISVLMFVWSHAYLRAPEATKYATVFLVMGLATGSLVVTWLNHAREDARRIRMQHDLRRYGENVRRVDEYHRLRREDSAARDYWRAKFHDLDEEAEANRGRRCVGAECLGPLDAALPPAE